MRRWFILSAIGQDRPGLVADLAGLIYDADANLEDSRMTILGTDFAVILLASSDVANSQQRVAAGAERLEREHGLTVALRSLEGGPRSRRRGRSSLRCAQRAKTARGSSRGFADASPNTA